MSWPGLDFPVPFKADGSIDWPKPNPSSPYYIAPPALISFSGGRTSGFMLFQILWAHGGVLPVGVHVTFANTGKEREETLRFVHECAIRWGVHVHWLEWLTGAGAEASARFEEVGYNSASRNGEPFKRLIARKKYLPNAVTRFCTAELKIETMKQFMLASGYKSWFNVVGLRADEMRRIAKQQKRNEEGKEHWLSQWPMLKAKTYKADVWRFWLGGNVNPKALTEPLPLGFDLGLWPYEGNCDYCFLKGLQVLSYQERERPGSIDDWIAIEALATKLGTKKTIGAGHQFVTEYSYETIKRDVERQPLLIDIDQMALEADAECGVGGVDTNIKCGGRGR